MSNHEPTPTNNDPADSAPSSPEGQNIPRPAEQSVELSSIIDEAFAEAEASGGELPELSARAVAQSLADQYDVPALRAFAESGDGDLEAISLEAMPIYNQPNCPPSVSRQIDYLLTFLLNRSRSTVAPATPATRELTDTPLSPHVSEGLAEHGDAFRAFLTLPDIDPDDPNVLDSFHEFYVGHFSTFESLLDGLTEIRLWERETEALADRHGIPGDIRLDMEAIEAHVRDTWDVVSYRGTLYVFDK